MGDLRTGFLRPQGKERLSGFSSLSRMSNSRALQSEQGMTMPRYMSRLAYFRTCDRIGFMLYCRSVNVSIKLSLKESQRCVILTADLLMKMTDRASRLPNLKFYYDYGMCRAQQLRRLRLALINIHEPSLRNSVIRNNGAVRSVVFSVYVGHSVDTYISLTDPDGNACI